LFDAEDPRIFAERVAKAHQERLYADSLIRYNYFIDNMPIQELPELDSEQVNRIILMVTENKYLKGKNTDTTVILNEVNLDFARTMNKIIFDHSSETQGEEEKKDMLKGNLTLPEKESDREAPYFGMVPIP
jgi:dynein heavy chain